MRFLCLATSLLLAAPVVADDVLRELLAFSAPPPGEAASLEKQVMAASTPPADDAPLDRLAGFWANAMPVSRPPQKARERLVDAIEKRPDLLPQLVDALPVREDVCTRLERARVEHEKVDAWLLRNCAWHRERLAVAAARATDAEGTVEGEDEVIALARHDWKRAEPVLKQLAGSTQPRARALALALLFEHDPSGETRRALQSIAADVHAPAYARNRAIETLGRADWTGRDEWLVSLMTDTTLFAPRDGHYGMEPISEIVEADPDRWIPVMTGLLAHSDRTVKSLAAAALVQFDVTRNPRADALRPLIPWISDQQWAWVRGLARLRLVQSVAGLRLRDAIPHLVHVVEHENDDSMRAYAADALADFESTAGGDAMRKALAAMTSGHDRGLLVEAMIRTNALSTAELVAGLEAFLEHQLARPEPEPAFMMLYSSSPSSNVIIGLHIVLKGTHRDDIAAAAIARARELETGKPKLAAALRDLVQEWPVPSADRLVVAHIENGTATATQIALAVQRRESLRGSVPDALKRLAAANGMRRGIAAAIAGDADAGRRILAGNDVEAQRALLASARLVREPLPLDAVSALFGRSKALDETIEAWLIADDSAAARSLVQKRHPKELLILGSRLQWDPGHQTHGAFAEWEKQLLAQFRRSGADELIALGSASAWSAGGSVAEIEIRGAKAVLRTGTVSKPLDPRALQSLRDFLAATSFDDLGPVDTLVVDGIQYEYVHLTRTAGRRVFMNNPSHAPGTPYDELVRRIEELLPLR